MASSWQELISVGVRAYQMRQSAGGIGAKRLMLSIIQQRCPQRDSWSSTTLHGIAGILSLEPTFAKAALARSVYDIVIKSCKSSATHF